MNGNKYIAKIDGLIERNRLLGIALLVMLAFNLMNWGSLRAAKSAEKVTIVPIGGSIDGDGMTIGAGAADERYIRHMARYIVNQVGSYTAGTVRDQLYEVVNLFPPESFGKVKEEFDRLATQIERYPSISSLVRWSGDQPLKFTKDLIQVTTQKSRLVNGSPQKADTVHYCIRYRIDGSRFWVLSIEEKEGAGVDLCYTNATDRDSD